MPGEPRSLETPSALEALRSIVARLRGPDGCPWDREQTHTSMRAGLLEETYETIAAINAADDINLREELGDVLLQVVFHAQIAAEQDRFNFDDVARGITDKLLRRHPHVFGDAHCADSAAVLTRWEEIKRAEKGEVLKSTLDGVLRGIPALLRAEQLQKKAAKVGFDWPDFAPVLAKLREEIAEVEDQLRDGPGASLARIEEEIGDVLFAAVNLARKLNITAELALDRATEKFRSRFQQIEQLAHDRGRALESMSLPEMDSLWDEVKGRASAEESVEMGISTDS